MNIMRTVAILAAGGALLAGCGSGGDAQTVAQGGQESTTTTTTMAATTTTLAPTTTTTVNQHVVTSDVTTEEGWRYRVTIAAAVAQPDPTVDRCVELAPPGKTNLRWGVTVENLLTDRSAPWPFITTGVNLNEAGTAVDRRATTALKAMAFRPVDIAPNEMTMCFLRSTLDGGSRNEHIIDPGGTEEFVVTAGPIVQPAPAGTALIVELTPGRPLVVPAL